MSLAGKQEDQHDVLKNPLIFSLLFKLCAKDASHRLKKAGVLRINSNMLGFRGLVWVILTYRLLQVFRRRPIISLAQNTNPEK